MYPNIKTFFPHPILVQYIKQRNSIVVFVSNLITVNLLIHSVFGHMPETANRQHYHISVILSDCYGFPLGANQMKIITQVLYCLSGMF